MITASNIGKRYQINQRTGADTLRDRIANAARGLFRGQSSSAERSFVWALKDVSFEIPTGKAVGIIGSNGSGKSTLLKILSRVTAPTEGRASITGRVGALLEVGTGFHPELTGRENVFVNGAILGMRRNEVLKKFDAIVDFAGVERFIDTPVKRYSSGMRLRLAFAVAAHLEPEILIVDEVLAVGDAEFQRRCLGRMNEISSEGRTVLFVSHQLDMVAGLCEQVIWLDSGKVCAIGAPGETIAKYVGSKSQTSKTTHISDRADRFGEGPVRARSLQLIGRGGAPTSTVFVGDRLEIQLGYETDPGATNVSQVGVKFWIEDTNDKRLTCLSTNLTGDEFGIIPSRGVFKCAVDHLSLAPGLYRLTYIISVAKAVTSDRLYGAIEFEVLPADFFGSGRSIGKDAGAFLTPHRWELQA